MIKRHQGSAGWPLVLLDQLAERGSGHTPNQREPSYWNGGIKWVSLADSRRLDQGLIYETDKQISALGVANSSAVIHPAGTVILSRDAGVGRSAILGEPMAVSQHFIAWRCGPKLHNAYLYQVLQSLKPEFERIANGSTVLTIGLPYFKRLRVPAPPLQKQVEIAEALDCWDRAIRLAGMKLEQLTKSMNGVARTLLSLRGLTESSALSDHFKRITRKNIKGCRRALTISGRAGLVDQSEYFDKAIAAEQNDHYLLLKRGEFAYNRSFSSGYPFGAIKRLERYDEGAVSTLYLCFGLNQAAQLDGDYAAFLFDSGVLNPQLRRITQAGARAHGLLNVTAEDFMRMRVQVPSPEKQRDVVQVLSAAQREVQSTETYLAKLIQQKRCLAREMLAGPQMPSLHGN